MIHYNRVARALPKYFSPSSVDRITEKSSFLGKKDKDIIRLNDKEKRNLFFKWMQFEALAICH